MGQGSPEFWFQLKAARPSEAQFTDADIGAYFGSNAVRFLGSGAFGETWYVERATGGTAVKILKQPGYSQQRLMREIEGLRRGACEHVVRLLSTGEIPIRGRRYPFLECEYVPGGSVGDHMVKNRWPSAEELSSFAVGVLKGLNALHDNDVIHRDIKDTNIILRSAAYQSPVIIDLGLTRIPDLPQLTRYPNWIGTAAYMAPEQIRGEPAHKGTDLWAVGVLLYLLACKEHPFYGDYEHRLGVEDALDAVLSGPKPLPGDVDACLAGLILRFLQPEPYMRGSARRALQDLERGCGVS